MIREKPAPHSDSGVSRFPEKIMRKQGSAKTPPASEDVDGVFMLLPLQRSNNIERRFSFRAFENFLTKFIAESLGGFRRCHGFRRNHRRRQTLVW